MSRFLNWKTGLGVVVIGLIGWWAYTQFGLNGSASAAAEGFTEDDIVTVFEGNLAASATASGQIAAQGRSSLSIRE